MTHSHANPYESLVTGQYTVSEIDAVFKNNAQRLPSEAMDLVDTEWHRQRAVVQKDGRTLFNGEMLRLDSFAVRHMANESRCLELSLSRTSYKNFVGTNMALPKGDVPIAEAHLANPLGVSALVICGDSKIVLGLRGKGTFFYSGYWHTFGGTIDLADVAEDGSVSLFGVMARELEEELGITDKETIQLRCIALVRDCAILQPELIFEARVSPSSAALVQRVHAATPQSSDEHERLISFEDTPDAAATFFNDGVRQITPVALAALTHHFGAPVPATSSDDEKQG